MKKKTLRSIIPLPANSQVSRSAHKNPAFYRSAREKIRHFFEVRFTRSARNTE